MATSAFYAVLRALFEQLGADGVLPEGCDLYDGLPTDHGYADDFLLIGVEDPEIRGAASSATASQEWAHATGSARDETGEVTCAARSSNGDADPQAARDGVEAITTAVETYLREHRDLGLTDVVLWAGYGLRSALKQAQDNDGAEALVVFTIAYRARLQ